MKRVVRIAVSLVVAAAGAVGAVGCGGRAADGGGGAAAGAAGGETASAKSAAAAGPCALFTQAEMGQIIGAPVTRQESPSGGRCVYYTADPLVYVDLQVDRGDDADASWKGVNAGNAAIGAAQDSLVGIGDQAFFGPRDRLYARKGKTFVAVEAGFDAKVRDRARKVAKAAFERAG